MPGAKFPTSTHALKQFFSQLFPDLISSIYHCAACHRLLDEFSLCRKATCANSAKESFICVPLQAQIRRKMEVGRTGMFESDKVTIDCLSSLISICLLESYL